jgi:hypothetical protein
MAIIMRLGVTFARLVIWLVVWMIAWLFAQQIVARLQHLYLTTNFRLLPSKK